MVEFSEVTSYTKDDFYCPVRRGSKMPVQTTASQKFFFFFVENVPWPQWEKVEYIVPSLVEMWLRSGRAYHELDLNLGNIRKFSCSCTKQVKFYFMRHRCKYYKKYQDEYGASSIIPNFQIPQDSVWNSNRNETSISDSTETYWKNKSSSGHLTFKCPLFQESNFTRQCLVNSNHLSRISHISFILTVITYYW